VPHLTAHDFVRVLGGKAYGDRASVPGPGHSKNDKSLSILVDDSAPGGFVVFSHAGDPDIGAKDWVREQMGIPKWEPDKSRPRQNPPPVKKNGHAPQKKEPITPATRVTEYIYRTAQGDPYLRVTRMSDKNFLQSKWDGHKWSSGKPAGPKIPYRLPELLARPDDPVFVVEGEKDADRLIDAGLIATTSSEGAGKWTASCASYLHGRDVFVIPDNDDPGRLHAQIVIDTLPGASLLVLPELPLKGDVSDWLDQGNTASDLMDLALNPPEPEPAPISPLAPTLYTWTEPHEIPRREWLYGRHLIRRYVSTTISPGGLGKSSLLMAEAIAMCTGRELLGERPSKPLKVWYWNGEDDQDENRRRVVAICKYHQITPAELNGQLFMDSGREKEILIATADGSGLTLNTELLQELELQIIANQIDVLVLDPFVASHNVGENDNMAINAVVRALARLAEHARCAVELVHHVRKPGGGNTTETDVNDARGASALIGGVRSARVLNVMSSEDAERLGVENRFAYFRVDNGKANLAPRSDQAVWRHIASVDLDNGHGQSSDHVGVVTQWTMPTLFTGQSQDIAAQVQAIVRRQEYRYDQRASNWLGNALYDLTGIDPTDKKGISRLRQMIDAWIQSGALRKEIIHDAHRKPRAVLRASDGEYE